MKKAICLILCAVMLLSLAACSKAPKNESTTGAPDTTAAPNLTAADTTVPENTTPQAIQLPLSAIFMPTITEEVTADDGTTLFYTTYQDVSLTMPDTDNADKIIMDLLSKIDADHEIDSQLLTWAQTDYTGQADWIPYFSEITYSPVRMDEKVLSLYGMLVTYGGGVHSNYACLSANYDLATGNSLTLADILLDEAAANGLCDLIIVQLDSIKDEYYLYDGYERTVSERYGTVFDTTWEPTGAWYLSKEGLGIYFSPYDIAPYAAGTIEVTIPYADLAGILKPDFFPAELPASIAGTVAADLAQDVDLESFSQFAEALLDSDGERVVLHTDGLVTNLTLEIGQWTADGVAFIPKSTVFTANTLTPGDAIMLYTMFSDTMPHIRLRYTSGGNDHSYFITQSGEDGSIILLDDLSYTNS